MPRAEVSTTDLLDDVSARGQCSDMSNKQALAAQRAELRVLRDPAQEHLTSLEKIIAGSLEEVTQQGS